ncbi:hypothetical protein OSTOST_14726 [Ostertagia ostertagi]
MDGRINLLFWRQTEPAVGSYYRQVHKLHPIVLLLELEETSSPNPSFLDAISYFPLIFWMQGKISIIDNLLRAGVSNAEHVVVVKEFASLAEEHLADCSTSIRMFPQLRMITELTHTSNMRFVQFSANNPYSLAQSKFEKYEKKRGSHMPYMFRLPFAQGGVFSANMLDRFRIEMEEKCHSLDASQLESARERRKEMLNHIRTRMRNMGMTDDEESLDCTDVVESSNRISFVIINPTAELQLEAGDIVYVLCSPVKEDAGSKQTNPKRGLRRTHHIEEMTFDSNDKSAEHISFDVLSLP